MSKTYSPEFRIQVVLEAIGSDRTDAVIARTYEIHPVTLSNWKKQLKEGGAKAFGGDDELKEKEKKIAKLERLVRPERNRDCPSEIPAFAGPGFLGES